MVHGRSAFGTLIYPTPCQQNTRKVEDMTTQKRQFGLALVLMTATVLALYPTTTLEKPQQKSAVVSIKANGQAFQNTKGKPSTSFSSATLTLYGTVSAECNEGLELSDLAGSLQIALANYTVTSGEGHVNKKNEIDINAKISDAGKKLELILHGSGQNNTVVFESKASRLSSLYFLFLKGQANVTMPATTTCTTESDHLYHKNATARLGHNNTVTETVTQTHNTTVTAWETSTTTVTEQPITVTENVTRTVTEPASTSTVAVTETVTSTIANSTITVMETASNTTA
jgi:hypothetical protein